MNMRNLISVIISLICFAATAQHPNFSLHNKADEKITVSIRTGTGLVERTTVLPNDFYDERNIDINKQNIVEVYNYLNTRVARYTFTKGKTIYITYNPSSNPNIIPQRGPARGLTGKTTQGFPLNNNVTVKDIEVPSGS